MPLIAALISKASLGQKPKNNLQNPLIILKKSPAIIVTRNTIGTSALPRETVAAVCDCRGGVVQFFQPPMDSD
ncbi:MAG: hypothetical protein ACKOEZ_05820 [Spartobacteria bacterium]